MNLKHYISTLLLGLICSFCFSQNYINYSEKDGLASNKVYRITQDHKGFIWFITDKGISKFDGTTFKNFTRNEGLPLNEIIRFRITPNNRFWYFSRSKELGYIENDKIYHFDADDGITMRPDQGINQSGNDISFLGEYQNYHFDKTTWRSEDQNNENFKLLNREVFYIKDKKSARLEDSIGNKLHTFDTIPAIRQAYQLNDSLFGVLTNKRYELFNLNTKQLTTGEFSPSQNPTFVSLDFHWVNNRLQLVVGGYLYCFNENLEVAAVQNSPPQLKTTFSFKDRDGFTWCATTEHGVFKLPKEYNNMSSFFNGKSISKITKAKNTIYVGVKGDGVYKFDTNIPNLWVKEPKPLYNVNEINNTIYYSFGSHYVAESKGRTKSKVDDKDYYAAGMLKYNDIYFSEGCSMVFRMSDDLSSRKRFKGHKFYQGLFKDRDSLFTFSYNNMLYYDNAKKLFVPYRSEQIGRRLMSHSAIENTTFIGTEGDGLYGFKNGKLFKLVKNDLAVVSSIGIENENSIWVVSEGVLLHYYKTEANEFAKKEHHYLSGYPTNNLTQVFFDKEKLYLGSTLGLTVIDKKDIEESIDFEVYLKDVQLNGEKQFKDSLEYVYAADMSLNLKFWSMNYYDTKNTTYQYRLAPIQNNWTSTASGEVNLFDLQPDSYTLQLKVDQSDTSKTLSIPIKVIPRWWQTSMFLVLAFLSGACLVGFVIWNIVKYERAIKLKKLIREKQLAQIQLKALRSQMNPHFVFNSLAAIQYYINENDFRSSEKYLVKFSRLIRTFFEMSKENEISIESEVSLLANYLDVEKLRFRNKFDYIIDIDPNLDKWKNKIPTMLLQPIVENAVNHGVFNMEDKGLIAIKFRKLSQDQLDVSISDDGVGFKKTEKLENIGRTKSSNVLRDRLYYLNKSRFWRIEYSTKEAFPERENKGNVSTFTLRTL
ncbi:sensor histidine kinase [Ulvibacter antarcticus]|uniref:Histidine kinase n=1 Tax=Ulvibacter antarcticus TaxID=442714 RepID=A0A3L9YKI8_9FLAO|nr:histidine kinase [Ulvibacter antarcticus]RMA58645.1 histidine kinase [Ulvibacter antarcticus]